jgi:hypothetical protein
MVVEGGLMRTRLPALLLAISLCAPAQAGTRNFGITGFTKIRVDGPFRVELATGVGPYATASGSPAALDRVAIDIQGSTLVVHPNRSSWGGYPGQDVGPVQIRLGTHELAAAWVNGAGTLAIDHVEGLKFDLSMQGSGATAIGHADVDQLNIGIAGTASATLAGRAGKMNATVRGISSLDAAGLATKDASIGAEGAATVKANISNAVSVDGAGPATITLTGQPACSLRVTGSASVTGCRPQ